MNKILLRILLIKEEFHEELTNRQNEHEHVLVYDYNWDRREELEKERKEKGEEKEEEDDGLHAVFVNKYNIRKMVMTCINSHGKDNPYPRVPISEARHLFRITCSAQQCIDQ